MRIVVKLGTHILTDGREHLSRPRMLELVRQMAHLHAGGHEMLLVSSGAIFAGREIMGPPPRRKDIPFKQTLAAVGQVRLMGLYENFFAFYDTPVAQALLTRADLADRGRYLNARNTLISLLRLRVLPIINENDVVAIDEIKIGDNDNLSALVANLVDADWLIILTDQAGLFTADPRLDPDARLIPEVTAIDDRVYHVAGGSASGVGTGGMTTKLEAAELATRSGTHVTIASGREPDVLLRLVGGEELGTRFPATASHVESRKRWILAEPAQGELGVDAGAAQALVERGKSLLAVGVTWVRGHFERGQTVRLLGPDGREIGRGITNYNASDLSAIQGHQSEQIPAILGYQYGPTVVHRDDLVILVNG
ncbi:MAG: glutamate 5-kinase [Anaerolineae bacterium]